MYQRKLSSLEKINLAYNVAKRNLDIATRAKNGESYESIGNAYLISRQRVSSILNNMAIHAKEIKTR